MKKFVLFLLPACFIAGAACAQHSNDMDHMMKDPEGIHNSLPLPQLRDAEAAYILLESPRTTYVPAPKLNGKYEPTLLPHEKSFFEGDRKPGDTPRLPKYKFDPWLKAWYKS